VFSQAQAKTQVGRDRKMRKQGMILKHHCRAAFVGRHFVHRPAAKVDRARIRPVETRQQPEKRRFPGAGGPTTTP
jgi:hypothetical protein